MKKIKYIGLIFMSLLLTGCASVGVVDGQSFENVTLNVNIQERSSDIIDYYLRRTVNDLTFTGTQTINSYIVTVADTTGVSVGNLLRVQEDSRLFQANILAINGNTLTLNTPLDYPYTSSADVSEASKNMNVDGSVTPVIFSLEPTFSTSWHITRIICGMTHSSSGSDDKFGNLPALNRGVIYRQTNGISHTFFNAQDNAEFRLRAYDVSYSDKAGAGLYSTFFRRSFGGEDKNGAIIKLDPALNESFQVVIQDDLTGLNSFECVLQGHIEEP